MAVAVIVATFGDYEWIERAQEHATPSAEDQAPTYHFHCATLAAARNSGLRQALIAGFDHVVFLDADDQLAPGYVATLSGGEADLRVPAVSYVKDGLPRPPYVPNVAGHTHECSAECMEDGNYAVIGSMADARLLYEAGGFREEPLYEDWSAWLRMVRRGATVETISEAVYLATWRSDSRNRSPAMTLKNEWHRRIHAESLVDEIVDLSADALHAAESS